MEAALPKVQPLVNLLHSTCDLIFVIFNSFYSLALGGKKSKAAAPPSDDDDDDDDESD